ncbi:hypothetical protein ACE6H2_015631 [Prunus campanulata]
MASNIHNADFLASRLEDSFGLDEVRSEVVLVGSIIADEIPNIGGIKGALRSAWGGFGGLLIANLRKNMFTITTSRTIASAMLEGGPWNIMNYYFNVVAWPLKLTIDEVPTHLVPIWVQISSLTLEKMNTSNARIIGQEIGEVLEVEDPVASHAISRGYLWVKVLLDSSNPLPTGFWLLRSEHYFVRVDYNYEGLNNFCYVCGRLGHCEDSCKGGNVRSTSTSDSGNPWYGPWMKRRVRAPSSTRRVPDGPDIVVDVPRPSISAGSSAFQKEPVSLSLHAPPSAAPPNRDQAVPNMFGQHGSLSNRFPSDNAFDRAMTLALTHRSWLSSQAQAQAQGAKRRLDTRIGPLSLPVQKLKAQRCEMLEPHLLPLVDIQDDCNQVHSFETPIVSGPTVTIPLSPPISSPNSDDPHIIFSSIGPSISSTYTTQLFNQHSLAKAGKRKARNLPYEDRSRTSEARIIPSLDGDSLPNPEYQVVPTSQGGNWNGGRGRARGGKGQGRRATGRITQLQRHFGYQQGTTVDPFGLAGDLALYPLVEVVILSVSKKMINTIVKNKGDRFGYLISWIYGPPYYEEKPMFWSSMGNLEAVAWKVLGIRSLP